MTTGARAIADRTPAWLKATPVFWESLRIPYNLVILSLIGHFDPGSHDASPNGAAVAFLGLLPANLGYCLGPLVEYYFVAFVPPQRRWLLHFLRVLLLAGGLALTVLFIRANVYVILYGI